MRRKKGKYIAAHRKPQRPSQGLAGRGVFISCPRNKEARAVTEAYDLLNEAVKEVHPGLFLKSDEDTQDSKTTEDDDAPDAEEEDIDAQIAKEISELKEPQQQQTQTLTRFRNIKTGTACYPVKVCEHIVQSIQAGSHPRTRFILKLFPVWSMCSVNDMKDVEKLVRKLLAPLFSPDLLKENGELDMSLLPTISDDVNKQDEGEMQMEGTEEEEEDDGTMATVEAKRRVVGDEESEQDDGTGTAVASAKRSTHDKLQPSNAIIEHAVSASNQQQLSPSLIKYRIEPHLRSHTAPLTRTNIVALVGHVINTLNNTPVRVSTTSTPANTTTTTFRPRHVVDLENPTHTILVEVLKSQVGLSVVEGYGGKGRKWNVQELASAARQEGLS